MPRTPPTGTSVESWTNSPGRRPTGPTSSRLQSAPDRHQNRSPVLRWNGRSPVGTPAGELSFACTRTSHPYAVNMLSVPTGRNTRVSRPPENVPDEQPELLAGMARATVRAQKGPAKKAVVITEVNPVARVLVRSEEHTSELQSLMRISYAVFCLKQKKHNSN